MADENLRRLALILFQNLNPGVRWSETDKEHYEEAVKAVISGMREPTEKQTEALGNKGILWIHSSSYIVWTTYIDALVNDNA